MITLEQAKRLNKVGFGDRPPLHLDCTHHKPDEKELMEWLGKTGACCIVRTSKDWNIILGERAKTVANADLTEALVQAVEKVNGREGKCKLKRNQEWSGYSRPRTAGLFATAQRLNATRLVLADPARSTRNVGCRVMHARSVRPVGRR